MIAPALVVIGRDLRIAEDFVQNLTLSVFLLAYAFGPFLTAPLSEVFGRCYVLQAFHIMFLAFNTGCGFARTPAQLIVCRFFAGIGGR